MEFHDKRSTSHPVLFKLESRLFFVVSLVLALLIGLLGINLFLQQQIYSKAISTSLNVAGSPDHAAITTYARAFDFSIIKTCTMFIGFVLAMLGALYLLRAVEVSYTLGIETGEVKTSLQTTSPGLVMVTLGVITVIFTLYAKTLVGYQIEMEAPQTKVAPTISKTAMDVPQTQVAPIIPKTPVSFSFEPGSVELSKDELSKFSNLCDQIGSMKSIELAIQGFGDPGKSDMVNLALKERRQGYIENLISQHCVRKLKITSTSYGESPAQGVNVKEKGQVELQITFPPK